MDAAWRRETSGQAHEYVQIQLISMLEYRARRAKTAESLRVQAKADGRLTHKAIRGFLVMIR